MNPDQLEMVRRITALERRMDDLVRPEVGVPVSEADVSDPPTGFELAAIWPNAYEGFVGLVNDNGAGTTVWMVVYVGGRWWYEEKTSAGEVPSPSPSESPSESPSASPSSSESPSESPSLSPSASESPSESPSLSPSASESPSESPSQSPSPSESPSASPSESPSASPSEPPWTPDSATTDGSQLPEHWYRADSGTWQDSVGNTVADDDGEVVGAWEDKAAAGDDVTQGTAANKPTLQTNELNGESVLRFDGSNDRLLGAFTSGGSMSQPNTVFVVAKCDASGVNDNNNRTMIDGDDVDNRHKLFKIGSATPDAWSMYAGTADINGGAADSNWNIWTAVFNGASSEVWQNGVSEITGNPGPDAMDGLSVGARYDGSEYWYGDIAEIIIYEADLSDADKNEIGGYLGDRYNISYSDIT